MTGIYKITNPDGKVYIGQSKNIESRFYQHKNNSINIGLRESIEKYGVDNHSFEVIEKCNPNKLLKREKFYIKKYKDNIFNLEAGRPKSEPTKVIRVPLHLKQEIANWLLKKKLRKSNLKLLYCVGLKENKIYLSIHHNLKNNR